MTDIKRRSDTGQWLVGHPTEHITGCKLPTAKQVLQRFFYYHTVKKEDIRSSARHTTEEVIEFWNKARIPTHTNSHATDKLVKLHKRWMGLKKSRNNTSAAQKAHREAFVSDIELLFDIAHEKALEIISIEEDRQFLIAQRERGRRGIMASVDLKLVSKEKRSALREARLKEREERETRRRATSSASVEVCLSDEECLSDTSGDAFEIKVKKSRKSVMSPELCGALDRTATTSRDAVMLVASVAKTLGHSVDDLAVSHRTVHRARIQHREEVVTVIKEKCHLEAPLVIHWDGKIMLDHTGEKVDRLPVLVSGGGSEQLLGVPKITCGTGVLQADAVVDLVQQWGLADKVCGLCFDTTSTNTGRKNGACVLIEQLGKDFLYFACRHHVLELVLKAAFDDVTPASSGPDVPIFKSFKESWNNIEHFQTAAGDKDLQHAEPDDIILFCTGQLESYMPRDDYRELLELAITFLGGVPPKGLKFRQPGAFHRARWMAKAIYVIKIWLFREQFRLSPREDKAFHDLSVFIVTAYIKPWFTAASAVKAPYTDLTLLQTLKKGFAKSKLWTSAYNKLLNHLWYLSAELVSLSFFDPEVPLETKRKMSQALWEREGMEDPPKRASVRADDVLKWTLDDFVSKSSTIFFERLGVSYKFTKIDPTLWESDETFQATLLKVRYLQVVNDVAERGVGLMKTYNGLLTKDEDDKQALLQVVSQHRKMLPKCTKEDLK